MMSRFRGWLPVMIACLLLATVFGIHYFQLRLKAQSRRLPPPPTVAVSQVRLETWKRELWTVGGLTASATVAVSGELEGKVVAIEFTSGQRVVSGQVLVRLDVSVEKAELDALRAAAELARLELVRVAKLRTRQFASQSDYDAAKTRLEEALARVKAKQAIIAKKFIRAPFNGQLGVRQVDLGEYIGAGTAVVTLTSLDPIYADLTLPQRHLPDLHPGLEVRIQVSAYPEHWFAGTVQAIEPELEASSRNIRIRALLDNPEERLRPGMFASVRVLLPGTRKVLTLPETAVVYRPYGDAVFVVLQKDGGYTVELRSVRTGERRGGRVEILKGVEAGDVVVSAGQLKLHPGMAIRVDALAGPGEREVP